MTKTTRPLPKLDRSHRPIATKRQYVPTHSEARGLSMSARELSSLLPLKEYVKRTMTSIDNQTMKPRKLALLIPAYNEEKVLAHTIQSAINAGMSARDIYVADDGSNDKTPQIARKLVGKYNVLSVGRSGKGLVIHKAAHMLQLTGRYRWIHIADADGEFDERYFTVLRRDLRVNNAAATGYVTSLPGSVIGQYRVYEYALGMEIIRRFQSLAGVITIVPGPTSVFRSDVFAKLNFNANSLTEDFDVTLQIHRQKLGTVQFIPEAVARTQDPESFKDYIKQITRWNRGVMQMLFKHKIGLRPSKIDAYLMYQVMQNLLFFFMYAIWVPLVTVVTHNPTFLAITLITDVLMTASFVYFAASQTKRWDIIGAFPVIYALRWVSLAVFMKAFVEVGILGKYRLAEGVWETVTRRATT